VPDENHNGAVLVKGGEAARPEDGWMKISAATGDAAEEHAYQFRAAEGGGAVQQTGKGDLSIERWAEICQTA